MHTKLHKMYTLWLMRFGSITSNIPICFFIWRLQLLPVVRCMKTNKSSIKYSGIMYDCGFFLNYSWPASSLWRRHATGISSKWAHKYHQIQLMLHSGNMEMPPNIAHASSIWHLNYNPVSLLASDNKASGTGNVTDIIYMEQCYHNLKGMTRSFE